MRVHFTTLGCRLNEAEAEAWRRDFLAHGIMPCDTPENADLVVVNTCAVTEEAARKSRQLVRRAQRKNPAAKLVMTGCYAALEAERAAADLGVDLIVPNRDKDKLVQMAIARLHLPVMPASSIGALEHGMPRRSRQRAFVKVQDGCRYRCSYCVVTLARGQEKSKPLDDVVHEVRALAEQGVQEVVLAGVHLGGYGSDLGTDLKTLVHAVLAQTQIPRLRLGSLEPWDLPDGFWELFDNPRLMPHLHLPMQSGADSVLRRMSRRCRSQEFLDLVATARRQIANFNVTTDIIVGFPGETEDEWQQTLDFVEQAGFGHVHVFAFSPRSGTKAAYLPNPVPYEIKRRRSEQLHRLTERLQQEFWQAQVGRHSMVLLERAQTRGAHVWLYSGYTENYCRVFLEAPPHLENRVLTVELLNVDEQKLWGRCVD